MLVSFNEELKERNKRKDRETRLQYPLMRN